MHDIAEVYAQELLSRGHGYPLWFPEPDPKKGSPQIGDVGYIHKGAFRRLFNVLKDRKQFTKGMPENYTPLEYDAEELDMKYKNGIQNKAISSHSVTSHEVKGSAGADANIAGAGISYAYHCERERGALLLMMDDGEIHRVVPCMSWETYMKKNHSSWLKWARSRGHSLKDTQCILVYGTVKTTEWTVAAFQSSAGGHSVSIEGTFVTAANVGFELSTDTKNKGCVEYRSGPESARHRSPSPGRSPSPLADGTALQPVMSGSSSLQLTHSRGKSTSTVDLGEKQREQCVFLPHYRIKYRVPGLNLLPKIQAGAGYDELPDAEDDDANAPAPMVVVTEDEDVDPDWPAEATEPERTPIDFVLEYILRYSDAEAAVACDDDINALFLDEPWPANLEAWLEGNRPRIDVEDGTGILSLEAAIQRTRRHTLEKIKTETNEAIKAAAEQMPHHGPDDEGGQVGPGGDDAPGLREVKDIVAEGHLILAKRLPNGPHIDWPHQDFTDREQESGAVSSMMLSPDGNLLVVGTDDSNVRLFNIKTSQMLHKWEGHEDIVWTVAFSPDGARVASGSADASILFWDPHSPQFDPVGQLDGHELDVWQVLYSPDGTKLASASVDSTIKIWDVDTQAELRTLNGHSSQVMHVAFTPDGSKLVSVAETVGRVWDVEQGTLLASLEGHTASIWSMAISHAGDRIITGSEDHTGRVWDLQTGAELVTIQEHTGPIWAVAFSPDDREVVTGSYDLTLVTNDSFSGERHHVFAERPSIIDAVMYSQNGKWIVSGSADGHVKLWDRHEGKFVAEWRAHGDKVKNIMFTPDQLDIISSSDDGSIRKWSLQDTLRLV